MLIPSLIDAIWDKLSVLLNRIWLQVTNQTLYIAYQRDLIWISLRYRTRTLQPSMMHLLPFHERRVAMIASWFMNTKLLLSTSPMNFTPEKLPHPMLHGHRCINMDTTHWQKKILKNTQDTCIRPTGQDFTIWAFMLHKPHLITEMAHFVSFSPYFSSTEETQSPLHLRVHHSQSHLSLAATYCDIIRLQHSPLKVS